MSEVVRENTQYGFRFGAQLVERCMELPDGRTVTTVTAAGKKIDIYASKTGRSLRVFSGNQEWKPGPRR